ncbi:MAG: PIN domain-containing protein [Candidatus Omnitrophica bacterium]|nr:PIN domain-containing protein [Candidatus Omnitrophota bacterium]
MITAVDTNILLDVLLPDPVFGETSLDKMRLASREGAVVICEIVYAEAAGFFQRQSALDHFLRETGIHPTPSTSETLWKAGELWRHFRLERPNARAAARRLLADFLIGAHALLQAERLLTRDQRFYRSLFSGLRLL